MPYRLYICGGNYRALMEREPCPDPLHDWPLPSGYTDAHEVANARIAAGWSNRRCQRCTLYGWAPSSIRRKSTNPVEVPWTSSNGA